ncbi:MAG: P-loop NTPase [Rhizobiales bacterium]|nr:P-loop NTPase [Hyphomicrobiales bacterium]
MSAGLTKDAVIAALRRIKGPDLEGNLIDLGLVSEIVIANGKVYFAITVDPERAEELDALREAAEKVVAQIPGVETVNAVLTAERAQGAASPPPRRPASAPAAPAAPARGSAPASGGQQAARAGVPGVRHIIAVASGKGGVGKSTTSVNLALALKANGLSVGILDADIYGPSMPRLLGISGRPQAAGGNLLRPLEGYGVKVMSIGFLVDEATPVIWRGPMVMSALTQMLREVLWGELDVIVVDMPPGTGDAQLTMAQQVPLSGAVIVSTPQDLALIDARKGLAMFRQVDVPVLGIIENMSYFLCPSCGERAEIFGHGGARLEATKLGVPFLGEIPLHMEIRAKSDSGQPVAAVAPDSPHARIYREIAAKVWASLSGGEGAGGRKAAPRIVIE